MTERRLTEAVEKAIGLLQGRDCRVRMEWYHLRDEVVEGLRAALAEAEIERVKEGQ